MFSLKELTDSTQGDEKFKQSNGKGSQSAE